MRLLCQGKYVSYYLLEWVSLGFIHILLSGVLPQGSLIYTVGQEQMTFEKCLIAFVTWGWASGWGSGLYCGG